MLQTSVSKMKKQVEKDHYLFSRYVNKKRWASIWHQLDEVLSVFPESVLEIGPGPGVFKAVAKLFDVSVETLDIDASLNPDHIAPADSMPFTDNAYDVVCAFQMLEHVPYDIMLGVFREMARVSSNYVIVSVPDSRTLWPYSLYIPKKGQLNFFLPRLSLGPKEHRFDGQHHWELNKRGYSLKRVTQDLTRISHMRLIRNYRVAENPYHRFLIFEH